MEVELPKYVKILNPTDSSKASELATLQAIYLAKLSGAELMPLFVVDDSLARAAGISGPIAVEQLTRKGQTILSSVKELAERSGVVVTPLLVKGQTAVTILDIARAQGASLIVMGATAFSEIDRLLAHPISVSEKVLRDAPCPVLVVRGS